MGETDPLDLQILLGESRLARFLVQSLNRMETLVSDLTDKIDAALTTLQSQETASADEVIQQKAQIDAAAAAATALQGQLDLVTAGEKADEAELQKVLDVLNALQNPPAPAPAPTPAPPTPAPPVDPTAPAVPTDPAAPPVPAPAPTDPTAPPVDPTNAGGTAPPTAPAV